MINAYINYWKGYVDFKGRTDPPGYWLAVLAGFIVSIVINIIGQLGASHSSGSGASAIVLIFSLITLLPSIAITVRRLRDGGNSWANIFWVFLPIAGPIILIVKLCAASQIQNAVQSVPAVASREAPLYRAYQPQANQTANRTVPAGATTASAASIPAYTSVRRIAETAGESRQENKDTFYVFAAQGAAFGNVSGDIGTIIMEKAEKLRDGYEPAKNMELSVIRPEAWGGKINVSAQNGVISSSFNLANHKQAIRNYLEKAGIDSSLIDAGIAISEKESLILTNPFSGVTVMGIPISVEKPAA